MYQVNTSTRTIFKDSIYESDDPVPNPFSNSLKKHFSSLKCEPHAPMNSYAPKDPRVTHMKPNYQGPIGPGSYDVDPSGERSTGPLKLSASLTRNTSPRKSSSPSRPRVYSGGRGFNSSPQRTCNSQPSPVRSNPGSNSYDIVSRSGAPPSPSNPGLNDSSFSPSPFSSSSPSAATAAAAAYQFFGSVARDPLRPSQCFASPIRGSTHLELASRQAATDSGSAPLGLDFAHWTSKGCYRARGDREIGSERWGPNSRERYPPPDERSQKVYDTHVSMSGAASTLEKAVSSSPASYRSVFGSNIPRIAPLPLGKGDTRFAGRPTGGGFEFEGPGPGQYRNDMLRLRSMHASMKLAVSYTPQGAVPVAKGGEEMGGEKWSSNLVNALTSSSQANNVGNGYGTSGSFSGKGGSKKFKSKAIEGEVQLVSAEAGMAGGSDVAEFEKIGFLTRATPHSSFLKTHLQVAKDINMERERLAVN
mmetsp:Transcript_14024/g.24581  ORF Transcript_14024/g.24581 Transcript_14024/m.24581 type:complete len:475 (-) Transcript_14024:21-1445(-)